MVENQLSKEIIEAAIEVHREIGPGVLESAYEVCMAREFDLRGIPIERQLDLPICYKGVNLDVGYRIDLYVDRKVIVELKAVQKILPIHEQQVLTYLRLTGCKLGLLLNFNVELMRLGIKRIANNL